MTAVFITSSGTEIGKTFVATMLIRQLQLRGHECAAVKPVISGFDEKDAANSDTGRLLAAQGLDVSGSHIEASSPWRFTAPLSPDMAAQREGRDIDFEALLNFCRKRREPALTLIEGIGGIMVPLDERHTVLDWIRELATPVILVVGSYLGSISHTLSAAHVLSQNDIELSGIVVNESSNLPVGIEETAAVVRRFVPSTRVIVLPKKKAGDDIASPDLTTLVTPYLNRE